MSDIAGDELGARARLVSAADALMAERGSTDVPMAAIAERAGVSRATAFRQLGSVADTITHVALRRSQHHVQRVREMMARHTGVFAKLEVALVYTTRELPDDPTIRALIARHSASIQDPRVHEVTVAVMGPVVIGGQQSGEIRDDLDVDEILAYLVEQTYLAAEDVDRSDDRVRRRLRNFIVPAIEARNPAAHGQYVSQVKDVQRAATLANLALVNFLEQLDPKPQRAEQAET